jgi:bifunctional DNA-binding transcriptional regulator/antitoxin component of YhaV-PrlF toxin-antitoxin module
MESPSYHVRIADHRRIVLPTELCDRLALHVGDTIVVRVEDDHAILSSVDRTIKRFQDLVAQQLPEGIGLVDQLIAEREAEAGHE